MAYAFVVDKSFVLSVGNIATPESKTDFDVLAALDGQRIIFRFSWNGMYQFYSVDILDATGTRIKKWYPKVDDEIVIKNWNETSATRPDAEFRIVDLTGMNRPLMPSAFGKTHALLVFLGRVKRL